MSATINTTDSASGIAASSDWGYISGRVSVLETMLLNRTFFEGMLKNRSLSDARSSLTKTPYRVVFTTDEHVRDYYTALENFSDSLLNDILKSSPAHVMKAFFEAPKRYMAFRNLFLRASARGASASDMENTFDSLAESPFERAALDEHIALLRSRETPQSADSVSRSLFLDSAVCTLRLKLAEAAPEEKVRGLLLELAILQCWAAVLRSRWNGTSAETVRRWFIVPEKYIEMVRNAAVLADANPVAALGGRISDTALRVLHETGNEHIRRNVDAAVGETVRDRAMELRLVSYGPERVLSYLAAYNVEQENLRLTLSSIVNGVEPRIVIERLRREYA